MHGERCRALGIAGRLSVGVPVQSISYRNAMYKLIMADQPGFRLEEIMCDIVHPNNLGHRCAMPLALSLSMQTGFMPKHMGHRA